MQILSKRPFLGDYTVDFLTITDGDPYNCLANRSYKNYEERLCLRRAFGGCKISRLEFAIVNRKEGDQKLSSSNISCELLESKHVLEVIRTENPLAGKYLDVSIMLLLEFELLTQVENQFIKRFAIISWRALSISMILFLENDIFENRKGGSAQDNR